MIKLHLYIILIIMIFVTPFSRSQDSIPENQPDNHSDSPSLSFLPSLMKYGKDTSFSDIKVFKNKNTNFKKDRNFLAIGLTGSLTAIGAYSSYLFKEISNDANINYKITGDESQNDKSGKYNTYFYISLILTQAAFAAFLYLLFID